MTKNFITLLLVSFLGINTGIAGFQIAFANSTPPVKIENLLRTELVLAEGVEIIVSKVEIGPNFSLPKHYHPGEEFVYMLEGTATVWQKDKPDRQLIAGDVFKVPFEQVHTAMTSEESAIALVFRVHKKGQPDRIPAE